MVALFYNPDVPASLVCQLSAREPESLFWMLPDKERSQGRAKLWLFFGFTLAEPVIMDSIPKYQNLHGCVLEHPQIAAACTGLHFLALCH